MIVHGGRALELDDADRLPYESEHRGLADSERRVLRERTSVTRLEPLARLSRAIDAELMTRPLTLGHPALADEVTLAACGRALAHLQSETVPAEPS